MKIILVLGSFLLGACGNPEQFRVRQFHLRDTKAAGGDDFIRAEMNKRLFGAVSKEERELRLGQYYNFNWQDLSGTSPVKIVFEYRQVSGGEAVRKIELVRPAASSGKAEIKISGKNYQKNGRVLSWRATLFDGRDLVAKKQSYLWE